MLHQARLHILILITLLTLTSCNDIKKSSIVPTLSNITLNTDENSSIGTILGSIPIVSNGDSAIINIELSGVGSTNFIVATDGTITVSTILDYETTPTYNLSAKATNTAGDSTYVNVTINVNNIAENVPTLNNFTSNIDENTKINTIVGFITIVSAGDSNITSFTLNDTTNFEINATGHITTKTTFDYETTTSYTLTAYATNSSGNSINITATININNIADTPPTLTTATGSVFENATIATVVGSITIASSGDSPIASIDLNGTGATNFNIATNGTITVSSTATLDYEIIPTYNLSAKATNAAGNSAYVNVIIDINNIADVVPTLNNFTTNIDENTTIATTIGSITLTTGDSNITSIDLNGTNSTDFSISTDGTITVSATLDYETIPTYNLSAKATNTAGDSTYVNVIIDINNILEPPTLLTFTGYIDENATTGTIIGNIVILSSGDSAITLIDLNGTGHLNFNVATNGVITVSPTATLDYETKTLYNLSAKAMNAVGYSTDITVTIYVNNIGDFYIKSAIYDNNRTTIVTDDKLYIYFNQSIKPASISVDASANYIIEGIGTIDENSVSDYNDTIFHRHRLQLTNSGSGTTAFIAGDTNISIAAAQITDTAIPTVSYQLENNKTTVKAFRPLLKTGQTVSYPDGNASDRDDGYYQMGLDRNYTRDNINGIVIDNTTKLMWQDDVNVTNSWSNAIAYCNNLSLGGYTDWKLPSMQELILISNRMYYNPTIEPIFQNVVLLDYWSSNIRVANLIAAWTLRFDSGFSVVRFQNYILNVRCVRLIN